MFVLLLLVGLSDAKFYAFTLRKEKKKKKKGSVLDDFKVI